MSPPPPFADLVQAVLDLRWNMDPVAATGAGLTQYDDRYGLFGSDDVKQYVAALTSLASSLEWCEPATLDEEIDRSALLNEIRVTIHAFERERVHVRNPVFWLSHLFEGLYLLLVLHDRPRAHRRRAARARVQDVPRFLETARATLADCPQVFVESAVRIAQGGALLLDQVEREFAVPDDPELGQVCATAREAVGAFVRFLDEEWLGGPGNDFAIGEEAFHFRLHYEHALRSTAPEVWRYGLALMEQVETELSALAARIEAGRPWPDVADRLRDEHPQPDELVAAYAAAMERARCFVEERGLAPILAGRLEVVSTPEFLRPLTPFAAYQPPGPFSSDRTGRFYVTPPDGALGPEVARALRDHCVHHIASTALHEGYPGHHLQFLHAVSQPRLVRKVVGSALSVEGWATYCEEMMGEQGFYSSPEQRLFHQVALLWRAVRVVVDVGLHTRGMGFDAAVDLLMRRLHFDRAHAEAEVRRYCAAPAYQLCYAVGRRELLALREAYRAAAGADFSLRRFHEQVLSYGGLPVSLMRWGMGLGE